MNEQQKQKLNVIKAKMKQREELLQELEESLAIRSLATDIPIGKDERCAIAWRENKGKYVLRIQNAAGEIQEIPEKDVPRVVHRPSHYKPFSRHIPKSQRQKPQLGVARKREGESQNE
jgi:hypothetical protein